jgi:salicylate hydroxylase
MRVAVAGAGIGGLTLAVALARSGHEAVVVEKSAAFGDVGAGIQISPNAARVLAALGLGDALDAVGVRPERVVVRRWDDDRELGVTTLGAAVVARYGFPYYNVFRPDLIEVLVGGVGGVSVRFDAEVTGVVGATLELADGDAIEADVVVGADGIHSAVRTALFGPTPARFSGLVAYRALVPGPAVAHLPVEVTNRMGPGRHLVSYFVGRDRQYYNLVCVVPEPTWDVESWTEPGVIDDLRAHFAGWSAAVSGLLEHVVEPVYRWALHDRQSLPAWSQGGATLLGDACHPMLPFMAQGACQAIEDAVVLRRCLEVGGDDVALALRRYEAARLPRTARIQGLSWRNATTYHLPDGDDQRGRDARLAVADSGGASDWLFGYDAQSVDLDAEPISSVSRPE